jgi:Zinc knuckle
MLLAQPKIPSLEEAVFTMIHEETRFRVQAGSGGLPGVKSALAVSNPGNSRSKGETRECYNCGEVGHLKSACTRPPKVKNLGGHGQSRGRGRGRRGGGRGGYRANLMVAEEKEEEGEREEDLSAEDQELLRQYSQLLRRTQGGAVGDASTSGNIVSYAHPAIGTCDTHIVASIPIIRSPWIVDSGASRHVTGTAGEFSSYTHLAVPESIQTADGTAQSVVGKGTVRCTNSLTLSNILHAHSFPVNLLSISAIILQLKCVVSFDIPKVIFQEKGTGRRLGTGTWHSGL